MARESDRLGTKQVEKLVKAGRRGMFNDGRGLYLKVNGPSSASWIFRYAAGGKPKDMGLGSVADVPLALARELRDAQRRLRVVGTDPIAHRRDQRASRLVADAKVMTFAQCADAYIASHEAGWGNATHRKQWVNTLAQYVYPAIGALPVAAIDTALVMRAIEPIWKTIPETASRVRGRIESILDWARVRGYRTGENPARWRGHLDHLLPARTKLHKVEHFAALAYPEIGTFMASLRLETSTAARALELTILTASRTAAALGARWDEIDLAAKVWTIPAKRMKSRIEHRVPLAPAAIAVLEQMQAQRCNEFVFPGQRGHHISQLVMLRLLRSMGRDNITVHGFRSTFRDWCSETTNFPRDVAEMALAHTIPSAVEAAYRRGDLFEKRRKLMESWATFCAKPVGEGKVLPLHTAKAAAHA
jgi:integrase